MAEVADQRGAGRGRGGGAGRGRGRKNPDGASGSGQKHSRKTWVAGSLLVLDVDGGDIVQKLYTFAQNEGIVLSVVQAIGEVDSPTIYLENISREVNGKHGIMELSGTIHGNSPNQRLNLTIVQLDFTLLAGSVDRLVASGVVTVTVITGA